MRLVITEDRSESFALGWLHSAVTTTHAVSVGGSSVRPVLFFIVECGIYCMLSLCMHALCAYSTFRHHPHHATLLSNFVSAAPSIAEIARGEK